MKIRSIIVLTLAFFTFVVQPIAETVIPPPDGAYPGGNTAEEQNALLSLTTGTLLGVYSRPQHHDSQQRQLLSVSQARM